MVITKSSFRYDPKQNAYVNPRGGQIIFENGTYFTVSTGTGARKEISEKQAIGIIGKGQRADLRASERRVKPEFQEVKFKTQTREGKPLFVDPKSGRTFTTQRAGTVSAARFKQQLESPQTKTTSVSLMTGRPELKQQTQTIRTPISSSVRELTAGEIVRASRERGGSFETLRQELIRGTQGRVTPSPLISLEASQRGAGVLDTGDVTLSGKQLRTDAETGRQFREFSTYEKIDKALLGGLPGGLTVREVVPVAFKEGNLLQKAIIATNPALYKHTTAPSARKLVIESASKVGKQIIPALEELDKEVWYQTSPMEFLARKTGASKLPIIEGIVEKGEIFGQQVYSAVRTKPYETAELIGETYVAGKLFATVGAGVAGKIISKGKITSRVGTFAVQAPFIYGESKALGGFVESSALEKGFTPKQAKTGAFLARTLQAEIAANIKGSEVIAKYPITATTKHGRWVQGFGRKIEAGAVEGTLATSALFDYTGEVEPIPGLILGGKKLLPSKEVTTYPAIDTLKDKRFKTETIDISRGAFTKVEEALKTKQYSRKELENFTNKVFKVTEEKDGTTVVSDYTYGVKVPEQKITKFKLGKIGTEAAGGAVGIVSAGAFGGVEARFIGKKGKVATGSIGYIGDPPELPGDILTELGVSTPLGYSGSKATVPPVTQIFIKQQTGKIPDIAKFGGELSRTQVKFKSEEFDITGIKEVIKVSPPTKRVKPDFTDIKTPSKTNIKDILRTKTDIKTVSKVDTKLPEVTVPSLVSQVTPSTVPTKEDTSLALTKVDVRTDINIKSPTFVNTLNQVSSISQSQSQAQTSALSQTQTYTTVFTPKLFLALPPLPGGGSGYGRGIGRRKGKIKSKFTPSLVAVGYGIKGKRSKVLTGLGIRPITKEFKVSKNYGFLKTKSKKTKDMLKIKLPRTVIGG